MKPFRLPQRLVSAAFWSAVRDVGGEPQPFEKTHKSALPANLLALHRMCRKLAVDSVIELGSGTSTRVLLEAGVTRLWTCDRKLAGAVIPGAECFQCEATQMLRQLSVSPDLFFFDGRLKHEDLAHVARLSRPDTWYAFDDFHGVEKGVCNVMALMAAGVETGQRRYLIVPEDGGTLAVLAPVERLVMSVYG